MGIWDWQSKFVAVLFVWGILSCTAAFEPLKLSTRDNHSVCPTRTVVNSILRVRDSEKCPLLDASPIGPGDCIGVIEGDEIALQKALNMVRRNSHEYVTLLFYASWCPFSRTFRPRFSTLASLYPSIPHFAIEESAVRPSILSTYGVRGFPTLFILNFTTHVRYRGSRSIGSLGAFYDDVAGIKAISLGRISVDNFRNLSSHENLGNIEQESSPFYWARYPDFFFPSGNLLGSGYDLRASQIAVLILSYSASMLKLCLDKAYPNCEIQ